MHRSLHNNPNILILPVDKGNTTVVLDKDDYLVEANRQLSDPSTYQLLTSNSTQSYNQDLHHLLSTAGPSQGLSETDISLLLNSQPCTPSLKYTNQVISAAPLSRPMTPQPNVSQRISMPTSNPLSNPSPPLPYPGYQPFSRQDLIPTYPPPSSYHHGHFDVSSLYTNIPHTLDFLP